MATKTKTAIENELRVAYVEKTKELFTNEGILQVGGNVLAIPVLDSEGNESWVEITVKVPKGERLADKAGFAGYDGYGLAEFFETETVRKASESEKKKKDALLKKSKRTKKSE